MMKSPCMHFSSQPICHPICSLIRCAQVVETSFSVQDTLVQQVPASEEVSCTPRRLRLLATMLRATKLSNDNANAVHLCHQERHIPLP